ncbi:MAG: glutaredoxin 2 [Bacteriovoracaceae bacterium]|nr:glutaredoxin 2 [Bacteriovoracaceae bacterium]
MKIDLYHYVHCPYCIRVRMALGLLGLEYASHVLSYEDEATPTQLIGKKMLPIIRVDNKVMNESLDIIRVLDVNDVLQSTTWGNTEHFLNEIGEIVHNLVMPYWIWTPEFSPKARDYFVMKKSQKRGPFPLLAKRRQEFEEKLKPLIEKVESQLHPFWNSSTLTIRDIGLAAHVWGLFVLPEFQFSTKMYNYLMNVKSLTHFDYHADFWKET